MIRHTLNRLLEWLTRPLEVVDPLPSKSVARRLAEMQDDKA